MSSRALKPLTRVFGGVVIVISSCADDEPPAATLETLPSTVTTFCETYASRMATVCAWRTNCCTELPDPSIAPTDTCEVTVETCRQMVVDILNGTGARWTGVGIERCVDTLVPAELPEACEGVPTNFRPRVWEDAPFNADDSCLLLFAGSQKEGTSCVGSLACEEGLLCRPGQGIEGRKLFTCKPLGREGDPCGCASGYFCLQDSDFVYSCHESTPGELCIWNGDCTSGNRCFLDEELTNGICQQPLEVGEACNRWRPCAPTLWCASPTTFDDGICEPRKADGEPCTESRECLGQCDPADGLCYPICGGGYQTN